MPSPPHAPTVLIADDEPIFASLLARQMRAVGLSVITDTTSQHVLDLARTHQPDLIILDINQRIDGRDLLARLKKDPATRELRVVVLTAHDDDHLRATCMKLGAHAFAVKPYDFTMIQKIAMMAREAARKASAAVETGGMLAAL